MPRTPRFSALWQEFKAFAFKGNMIELAVAVVIGAAFSAVINSLVKDIIMPGVSYVTTAASTAGKAASEAAEHVRARVTSDTQPTQPTTATTEPAPAASATAPPPPAPAPAPAPAAQDAKPVNLDWTIGRFQVGHFVAELLNFVLVAFAVFLVIVKLLGSVMKRVGGTPKPSEPTTKECPYCLSVIPLRATKCANCTADLPQPTPA